MAERADSHAAAGGGPPRARQPEAAWSPLDFDQEAFRATASATEFRRFARNGVRQFLGKAGGSGTADVVRLDHDDLLSGHQLRPAGTGALALRARGAADHVARQRCVATWSFQVEGAPLVFDRPEVTLRVPPAGLPLTVDITGACASRASSPCAARRRFRRAMACWPTICRRRCTTRWPARARSGASPRSRWTTASPAGGRHHRHPAGRRDARRAVRRAPGRTRGLYAGRDAPYASLRGAAGHALHRRRDVELAHGAMNGLAHDYRSPPLLRRPGASRSAPTRTS